MPEKGVQVVQTVKAKIKNIKTDKGYYHTLQGNLYTHRCSQGIYNRSNGRL